MIKKICFISGTRAEYGLLSPLMHYFNNSKDWQFQLIVTGSHLSNEYGNTYKEIVNNGFKINIKIDILSRSDTETAVNRAIASAIKHFSNAFYKLKPDFIVVLGDRYEILSASIAAMVLRIPIIHLYGGESTYGAFDEAIRHSITKMSFLHFTSTEIYRKRIIQLGEHPSRVFNVGAIGIDNIKNMKLMNKDRLENDLNVIFKNKNLLVTFHPITLEGELSVTYLRNLLRVFNENPDIYIIFTKANADPYGKKINRIIDAYVKTNKKRSIEFTSLGQLRYLSLMQFVDGVVGNSSSGIIEAPSFSIGTINIGDRQKGRIKARSIIDCSPNIKSIRNAMRALYSNKFRSKLKNVFNPYGDGKTTERIIKEINKYKYSKINIKKEFYDVNFKYKEDNR